MSKSATSPPALFDRALLRKRREKYLRAAPDFIDRFLAVEFADRLSLINRSFETVLVTRCVPGLVGKMRVSALMENVHVMDYAANCPDADIAGDEEWLPFANEKLSCILSPLTLQFVNDLPGALLQARRAMAPDGLFIGAMLGGSTLNELRDCLLQAEGELGAGVSPRVAPFTDVRDGGALLQRAGFALPVADSDTLTVRYGSIIALMKDLRHLGWANALAGRTRGILRRDVLARVAELYAERYSDGDGKLRATFQIVWLTGWAPHESQQKPLKPGSAKARLADALGAAEQKLSNSVSDED
ncbi:MAG: class I SAM-dependent methyltransferase [Hyphomicrobiales bacterium]